ncbi:MAG: oxaloacetate decarboxylase [Opitutae bacterium]|nr:oxaloacetate decarboxylase [Opitutae bacterium]MBT4223173.1 oxaloacetate decarboxylase [Opitutae bacterium]MBT5380876.1 oxaloacetate decarboxylase [Opitutae bacterium]MBT5691484.1 oxaloacetate decarboxylase [Opitutae bacterium]MBT6462845.1 oxaloacetate decarboxylase [Opitutae bacterium]
MIQQGVVLMIVGMGVVSCFLVLLVFTVQCMGSLLRNTGAGEPEVAPQPIALDDSLMVAVAAAKRCRDS